MGSRPIPFLINVPDHVLAGGELYLTASWIAASDPELYVSKNLSPSNARNAFMRDDAAATAQLAVINDPLYMIYPGPTVPFEPFLGDMLEAGENELLLRAYGSGIAKVTLDLIFVPTGTTNEIRVDRSVLTFKDISNFYSVVSARGTEAAPIAEPSVPFRYRSEGGRTEVIQAYPYAVTRDKRDSDVSKTLVYLHGYNNNYVQAEDAFATVFKRLYWQGFRGNFVGFSWHGDEGWPTNFDDPVRNALQTSPSLWMFLRNVATQPKELGGWGLKAEDIDLAAHSLGNLVMWDAIRLNGEIAPNEILSNNATSIEAAIWSEAFDPSGPVTYGGNYPIIYTAAELESMSWHHWFNPAEKNIKASLSGKVFHSYHNEDEALLAAMRTNDVMQRSPRHFNRSLVGAGLRTASNLVQMPALMLQGHRSPPLLGLINADDISLPIGSVPNPLADRNIDAAQYGWDNTDGWNTIPGTGDSGHSDHVAEPYPDTYRWWRHLFAGDGNSSWAAAAIGVQ